VGQVIGVNEQIAHRQCQSSGVINTSIPSNWSKIVADALIKDGQVQHTYLGIGGMLPVPCERSAEKSMRTRAVHSSPSGRTKPRRCCFSV
jgi:S1-C subfamily serine protease